MEIRIFEHLNEREAALVTRALSLYAPDLLEQMQAGASLAPGPRLRLEDVLYRYMGRIMTPDDRHTPGSEEVERLIGRLLEIQPIEWDRLKGGSWKKGDPIPRGMARYEEIEDDA